MNIEQILQKELDQTREAFNSHLTKSVRFRKEQLTSLLKGWQALKPKICKALETDLRLNSLTSQVNYKICEIELQDVLSNLEKWAKPRPAETPMFTGFAKSYLFPEPYGVVLVMNAWNYPFYTSIPAIVAAIAAGNCVICKPSELSPSSSTVLKELFDNYLDNKCYRVIEGDVEISKNITLLPFDYIVFTGSSEKGKLIAMNAAKNLTPVLLELGGKSPCIVDSGADIDNAAKRISWARFTNSGQTCIAVDHVFVHQKVKEKFITKMKETLDEYYGKDAQKSPDFSRIITQFHAKRLQGMLEEDHMGEVIIQLGKPDVEDRFIPPTVVDNPDLNSKIMQEEIFGPILPIFSFEDIDYVIAQINKNPKPLALYYYGSIWDKNIKKLRNETSSGAFSINDSAFHILQPCLPFGGVGNSGIGACRSKFGFDNLSHLKPVLINLNF